MNNGIF